MLRQEAGKSVSDGLNAVNLISDETFLSWVCISVLASSDSMRAFSKTPRPTPAAMANKPTDVQNDASFALGITSHAETSMHRPSPIMRAGGELGLELC